ncbi:MAG TPA: class I SAM-dependent methyltransferase, partial [Anaerolineae bacterium]|nr:class I SAM-dependent methyltransferase [Anaerolineae bacterium]
MSIVFDRAVEFYDQTRAVPSQILDKAFDALIRETGITHESRVLEIGIGTGRIALPLSERIGRVFGVDLSLGMMSVLQNKMRAGHGNVLLAQADVLHLPFPTKTFDLIYAVHVLHLVMGWQAAVTESWRTLKPDGRFVANYHRRGPDMPNVVLRKELHKLVEPYGVSTKRPGAQSEEEIYEELSKWDPNLR